MTVRDAVECQELTVLELFFLLFAISSPIPFMTPHKGHFEREANLHFYRWGWWRGGCSTLRLMLVQVLEVQYTLGSTLVHFPVGVWSMFTLKLLISAPLADEESWCTKKFVYPGVAGIQCLVILCKNNACLRQAGWIKEASSTTPSKLIRRRFDVVWRKWIFRLRNW